MNNFEKHMDELIELLAEAQDTCVHEWERLNKQWLREVV